MRKFLLTGLLTACVGASALASGQTPPAEPARPTAGPLKPDTAVAAGYVGAARALANVDDNPLIRWTEERWCETGYRTTGEAGAGQIPDKPVDRVRDLVSPLGYIDPRDDRPMPAGGVRFFDNAWYFGTDVTGMVVVKTDAGLLMFDALTNAEDMQSLGIDQMKAAGLDPAQIRYIFIGHEHVDHIGGINLILDRYAPGAKIVASAVAADAIQRQRASIEDGTATPRLFGRPPATPLSPEEIKRRVLDGLPKHIDIRVDAFPGMNVGLRKVDVGGGIEVTAMFAPGHTLGQMHAIVPVTIAGKPEKLLVWSGNDAFERADIYAASTDFVRSVAMTESAGAFLNTHAYQGAAFHFLRRLHDDPKAANPMAMGRDGVQRYLGVFAECQRAQWRRAQDGTWLAL